MFHGGKKVIFVLIFFQGFISTVLGTSEIEREDLKSKFFNIVCNTFKIKILESREVDRYV